MRTFLLTLLLATTVSHGEERIRLPDIGDSSEAVLSEQSQRGYSRALLRELRRIAIIVDDPLVSDYIEHLGYSLVAHSDEPDQQFIFVVIQDNRINAFAAPGGLIAMHTGLLLAADNQSEVAGVMAHEIAHVTQLHVARRIQSAQQVSLPLLLLMLGAAVAGGGGDATQAALVGGSALQQQLQINFTRDNEFEADRIGIQTLARAGYDPMGVVQFFQKLARQARNYRQQPNEYLSTHPIETTRIAEARDRAALAEPMRRPERSDEYFLLIRERLRVLSQENPLNLIPFYQHQDEQPHMLYGMGLAYLSGAKPEAAVDVLRDIDAQGELTIPVRLALARARFAADSKNGEGAFETLLEEYPSSDMVRFYFAEALMDRGRSTDAIRAAELLRPLTSSSPIENPQWLSLHAQAAAGAGEEVRAHELSAEYFFRVGRLFDAIRQLELALRLPELNYYERSRIHARLGEFRPLLAQLQREGYEDPSEREP